MAQQIDYAKLAKQHGGQLVSAPPQPDYAAIAKEYQTPPAPEGPQPVGQHPLAKLGGMVTDALPMIGGGIGGVLGAPGIVTGAAGAAVGGAAGEAGRQLLNRAMGREAPGTMGEAAADIGLEGGVQGALEGAAGAVPKLAGKAASAVYRGYLKPSLAGTELAKARDIVQTALREALPIAQAGEARAKRLISQINQQVNHELRNAGGRTIDLHRIAERVRSFGRRTYSGAGAPEVDLSAVMKVADEIDKHPALGLPAGSNPSRIDVTPTYANETKQRLDKAIGDTGFGVERNAPTEARKVGRHAARVAIEDAVPAVKGLNKRESELIDALESLTKATGREANKSPLDGWRTMAVLGGGSGIGMGAGLDPVQALVAAAGARVALSPNLMSRASILAHKFSKVPGTDVALAARMGLIIALRESEESRDEQ